MNKAGERLWNGLVKENPTLVLMLGMCPTLAVTTSAVNGFGMGATTLVVLALSNLIISLLRKVIPKRVRIPAFIVIIASFVTIVQLLMQAYLYSLNKALGVYIPLIVVNCIILGRAESYAYSNPPIPALFDGIGMGLGFTVALTCIGAVRELLGAGQLFGFSVMPDSYEPALIFVLAPGAFFVLAALTALQNFVRERLKRAGKPYEKIGSGCSSDCMNCSDTGCSRRFYDTEAENAVQQEQAIKEEPKQAKAVQEERDQEEAVQKEQDQEEAVQEERDQEAFQKEQDQEEAVQKEPKQEEALQEEQDQEEVFQEEQDQEEAIQKERDQEEAVQEEAVQEEQNQEEAFQKEQDQEEAVQEEQDQEEVFQEERDQEKAVREEQFQENEAQDEPAQPEAAGRLPQNNKITQNNSRTQRKNKTTQNNSSKASQDNQAARNSVGKAAQYDKASRHRKTPHHHKVPRQGRKK